MNAVSTTLVDSNLFSPSNWPDYTIQKMRVGWINEKQHVAKSTPDILSVIPHIPIVSLITFDHDPLNPNLSGLLSFFESIEVLVVLREYYSDPSLISMAASMGRVIVTDNTDNLPLNHGENAMVVKGDPATLAETLVFLQGNSKFRGSLGRNIRAKYLELMGTI